tara:strand:+ start:42 stop:356 length:315 start_codon:yes stop_codon:yes gene_type:complete
MTALQELLAKVEAGEECDHAFAKVYPVGTMRSDWLHDAYSGSLDAAIALHKAVLPGWRYNIWNDGAHVRHDKNKILGNPVDWNCPARALLIADIQALIAKEKST